MGDGFVQGINDVTLYAEKIYRQNFTQPNKKFVLSLHYNDNDSYLFINGKQVMQVCKFIIFLMRLNETRNALWHESCKCVCKLSSSVCNNKQILNDDTCRCDCNEDFAGIINCAKGYM